MTNQQSREEIRRAVESALFAVAPDLEDASFDENEPLRESYDLDSADFLNFVIRIHETLGVDIPEADYPKLSTLSRAVDYVAQLR